MVKFHNNLYARRGADEPSHIPALPFWFVIIRIVQILFAFLVLVLAAYAGNVYGSWADKTWFPGYGMSYFTFAWTLLFFLYLFATHLFLSTFYHYWIHLGLEFLTTVFWLTTFALLANESSIWTDEINALKAVKNYDNDIQAATGIHIPGTSFNKAETAAKTSRAATAFAALDWILFMVTLIAFGFYLHKHRIANGATGFAGFGTSTRNGATGDVEKNEGPVELRNVENNPQQTPAI